MIEVVALMIGQIEQRYSEHRYENPAIDREGHVAASGRAQGSVPSRAAVPLSCLFQRDRIRFACDLVENQQRCGVQSRFSLTLG